MNDPAASDEAGAVRADALRLLARREHSRRELGRKLARRHADAGLVDSVLDELERRALLSEARFVEAYVRQRAHKGYGPLRIRAELSERGVAAELVAHALGEAGFDWAQLLDELVARRFAGRPAEGAAELARRGRFLAGRGFPAELVARQLARMRRG